MIKPNNQLETIEVNPHQSVEKCIIWLHGLGADGHDFAPIVPELRLPADLGIRFVFPHAPIMPISINNGYKMRAWFDILEPSLNSQFDFAGVERSLAQIEDLISQEVATHNISPGNIMLAGFSQGAVIALASALLHPEKLAGVIALSGLLPHAKELASNCSNHSLPIFMGHGTTDQIVPLQMGLAASNDLKAAGFPVSWHTYPMAHTVCAEEIKDISGWIQKIWG